MGDLTRGSAAQLKQMLHRCRPLSVLCRPVSANREHHFTRGDVSSVTALVDRSDGGPDA